MVMPLGPIPTSCSITSPSLAPPSVGVVFYRGSRRQITLTGGVDRMLPLIVCTAASPRPLGAARLRRRRLNRSGCQIRPRAKQSLQDHDDKGDYD
jgi:hypothetical protein